ncbi:uncharacterized protein LOC124449187 [Xenia sp. Carnegie-2017]|uniref:uncharacterized protein LOC124449187 n=1 Tax=Xenia sp. Carnegie-2017 TaxID=2897299 RepID=UPI001F04D0D8|nr:uncharacterized protein LOC124449187 [Xenia sp. Carnegie-2017]
MLVKSFIPDVLQHYLDANMRLSSAYCKYNPSIPEYLHNRPPHFLKCCLENRYASAIYKQDDIPPVNLKKGTFNVKSESNVGKKHFIDFREPSCTCNIWHTTHFPCKHFFAVFSFYDEWDFESLPEDYRNSVFITLNNEPLALPQDTTPEELEEANTSSWSTIKRDVVLQKSLSSDNKKYIHDIPHEEKVKFETTSNKSSKRLRKILQEQLGQIHSMTFLIDNETTLQEAVQKAESLKQFLEQNFPTENGLPLRLSPVKKKLKVTETKYHQIFHKALPPRRRKTKKSTPFTIDLTNVGDEMAQVSTNVQNQENEKRNSSSVDVSAEHKANPLDCLLNASLNGIKLGDQMLELGPNKVTLQDLWTLIPPNEMTKYAATLIENKTVAPGWLSDTVINAFLWKLSCEYPGVLPAESYVCQLVQRGSSTRQLWADQNFMAIDTIIFPLNRSGSHWTLLVIDKQKEMVYYLDPMEGHVEEVISEATRVELSQFIKSICALVDLKSGWNTSTWSIIQPSHYVQEDGFNCGIIICLFAEYLSQNLDINAKFDMRKVRQHMTSTIMGSCYDDIYERNSLVCKICKMVKTGRDVIHVGSTFMQVV